MKSIRNVIPVAAVAALLISPVYSAAQGAGPTMQQAGSALGAQDYPRAIELLEEITSSNDQNARAWGWLGWARLKNGDYAASLEALEVAVGFPQIAPNAMYNAGLASAKMNDLDAAFEWFGRARDTGRLDLTQVGTDPDAEEVRSDPRYKTLFPSDSEFADPFVEPATVLVEWIGEEPGDQFGWIARNIGDVDGDHINDVATSAPSNNEAGQGAGKIYVYSSRTQELLWTAVGDPGFSLGLGIEAAGDVNADDVPDVIAGAPGGDRTLVYSGRDGSVLLTLRAEGTGDNFGRKVSDVGDVNGDGHDDVLVGSPLNDGNGQDAGAAYVFSGADGSTLLTLRGSRPGDNFGNAVNGWVGDNGLLLVIGAPNGGENNGGQTYVYDRLSQEPKFVIESDETGARLGGMFVSVVGDVDADGIQDVYASDWSNRALGPSTGRIFVHSGATGERLYTLTGEAAGDGFGIGTADAGDVDGDGYDDLVIGAWQHKSAAASGGKVYIYSGRDGSLIREITGKVMGETFGFDTTGMGDINGDGTIDYLITSAWSAIAGTKSGRMFIVSGAE